MTLPGLQGSFIEKRLHTRHKTSVKVHIRAKGKPTKTFTAVNLSATGVGVLTESFGLPVETAVDLTFALNMGSYIKIHRREAMVRHVKNGVTGFSLHPVGTLNFTFERGDI